MSHPQYFEIFKSLHRGGLSLWLNRTALLPLTALPIAVTFLTMAFVRYYGPDDISYFTGALLQLPADFCIGLFSSLIILIIMSAPKKKDDGKPMMFAMNLANKKNILIAGALAHTVFGYLYLGGFAAMDKIAEPLRIAAQQPEPQIDMGQTFLLLALLVVGLYAIRFAVLPILVVGNIDIKSFYKRNRAFGFSIPVFFIKVLTMMAVGLVLMMPMALVGQASGDEASATTITMGGIIMDFASAFSAVIAHAWAYAALAIGIRSMMDKA
jgi:hypothetical protein